MSDEEKKKGKSFKSINEILNISDDDISFNEEDSDLIDKYEKTKEAVQEMKDEFKKLKTLSDDDFSKNILKQLVEKSMTMLTALQLEIEDNPTGRSVETAATMVSAINGVIDNFNKIKVYNTKLDIEQQKLDLRKSALQKGIEGGNGNTNVLMVADSNDILDFLGKQGILPNTSPKTKDVTESVKVKDDDKDN